jgi:sugar-specific transcriptional regulator TrmB
MKYLETLLTDIGLTLTEAKIYIAGRALKTVTVQSLAQKTKVKRPTIYHAINSLLEKGLVTESKRGNKAHFTMSPPENIRGLIEEQRSAVDKKSQQLDAALPLLMMQSLHDSVDALSVVQYHGIDGMKTVMDIAFHCKSKHWDVIAPYKNFLRDYDAEYAQKYLRARKYHGITSRTLWEEGMRTDRGPTPEERRERNPRLMPWTMHGKFKSMMILFDDKIAIFTSLEHGSAILISSQEIHSFFHTLFEGIWEFSEQY